MEAVSSENITRKVADILSCMKACECTKMLRRNGSITGLKKNPLQMHAIRTTYFMN